MISHFGQQLRQQQDLRFKLLAESTQTNHNDHHTTGTLEATTLTMAQLAIG